MRSTGDDYGRDNLFFRPIAQVERYAACVKQGLAMEA